MRCGCTGGAKKSSRASRNSPRPSRCSELERPGYAHAVDRADRAFAEFGAREDAAGKPVGREEAAVEIVGLVADIVRQKADGDALDGRCLDEEIKVAVAGFAQLLLVEAEGLAVADIGIVPAPGELEIRQVLAEVDVPPVGEVVVDAALLAGDRIGDLAVARVDGEPEQPARNADGVQRDRSVERDAPALALADISGGGEDAV